MLGKIACPVGGIAIGYLARDTISDLVEDIADVGHSTDADDTSTSARNTDPENVGACPLRACNEIQPSALRTSRHALTATAPITDTDAPC